MPYSKQTYHGYLVQGNLLEAVKYLSQFPQKEQLVKRFKTVFSTDKILTRSKNPVINQIDAIYQTYYKKIFWHCCSQEEGEQFLCESLASFLQKCLNADIVSTGDRLSFYEDALEKIVQQEGYHFLGGKTAGYYGPYIWKSTEVVTYDVELPTGIYKMKIAMMDDFVSRSWLDYLSFGKIGTGGWSCEDDGMLYCVRKCYGKRMDKPGFLVSYLKHESQHAYDQTQFGGISSMQMEYRAKLVELIYYPNLSLLNRFLAEASQGDSSNSHAYASYLLVRNLSSMILHLPYEDDPKKWRGSLHKVQLYAKRLLDQYPDFIENAPEIEKY